MEIIEKIQLAFDDLDEERSLSVARTCSEMVAPLRLDLAFRKSDRSKLKMIQSKQKEAKKKIKEMAVKARYAVDLYQQHLDIELKKVFSDQVFNIPLVPDDTSIFKVEMIKKFDGDEEYNQVDHVECALVNAQKAGEESIVWIIFYSELEELELEIREAMGEDMKNEPADTITPTKEYGEEMKIEKSIEKALPVYGTTDSSKYLQIFKEGGAELFDYFQSEYTIDDHSPVAKYSYIYRFLFEKQLILARSQPKYMQFIKESFGVNMSKIFRENYKYKDDIYPILRKLKSDFVKGKKSEMN